jgi:hypothetical protein
MSSCMVLDPLGTEAICRLGHLLGCSGEYVLGESTSYRLVLLIGVETFVEAFVVFNGKLLSYNNNCCTTHRC